MLVGDAARPAVRRLVEEYDSLVELDVTALVRGIDGWILLSAGEVGRGRWWAEYQQVRSDVSPAS